MIERIESEDSLCRCSTHLLQISQACPIEHLFSLGLGISKRTATITTTHHIAISIWDGQSLGTHDDSLMEQTTSQRRLAEGADTTASGTLSEDSHVVRVATELLNILLYPLQSLYLVEDAIVARYMIGALCRKSRMYEESEDAQTIVDADKHHILGSPLLTVELRLRAPALTIAATMNPESHRELLRCLSRCLGPYVQIQTILAERSLLTITPFGIVTAWVLNSLIAWMSEGITNFHTLPRHYRLWSLPTVLLDRRCCVRYSAIDIHVRVIIGSNALNLTAFNTQYRVFFCIGRHCGCK